MLLNGWSSLGGGEFDVNEEMRGTSGGKGSIGKEKTGRSDEGDIGEFRPERWLAPDEAGKGGVVFEANAGPSMPMSANRGGVLVCLHCCMLKT